MENEVKNLSLLDKQYQFIQLLEEINDTTNQCSQIGEFLKEETNIENLYIFNPIFGIYDTLSAYDTDKIDDKISNFLFYKFIKYLSILLYDAFDIPFYDFPKINVSYVLSSEILNNLDKKINELYKCINTKTTKLPIDFLLKYKEIFFGKTKYDITQKEKFGIELIDLSIQFVMMIILYNFGHMNSTNQPEKFLKETLTLIKTESLFPEKILPKIYNNLHFILFLYFLIHGVIVQIGYLTQNMKPFVLKIIENIRNITNPKYIILNCNYIINEKHTEYCCGRFVTYVNNASETKIIIMNTLPDGKPDVEYEKKIQENPEISNGIKFGGNCYLKYLKYKTKYLKLKKYNGGGNTLERIKLLKYPPIKLRSCNTENGIVSLTNWYESYNFPLNDEEEKKFKKWMYKTSEKIKRNLWNELKDYDFRVFWIVKVKNSDYDVVDERGHFSDIGKKPNHVTFSTESFWNGAVDETGIEQIGGIWINNDFKPSQQMLSNDERMKYLIEYFEKHEPKSKLIIPEKFETISFPDFEIENYKKQLEEFGIISTHRICDEYNKYKLGMIYQHPELGKLKVVSITEMINIKYSPAYFDFKNWTDKQQKQLIELGNMKTQYIVLEKIE